MKRLHWTLLLLSLLPGSSGEEKAEKVTRALGESVTFQVEISEPFTAITWLRIKTSDIHAVALLKPGKNCATIILHPDLEGRLNVSGDCKRLQVKNLNQDDSGRYQAQIQIHGQEEPLHLFFDLHVYKRLSDADLSIHCKEIGNGTWWLNCSAEPWEDGVKFNMALGNQRKDYSTYFGIQHDFEESNLNITCTAENPVSNASRTESFEDICDDQPFKTQTDYPETSEFFPEYHDPWALIGTTTALALIVAKVFISGCVFARWPCCSLGREGYRKGTRPHRTT